MQRKNLSLKWLEVFKLVARSGSVQTVAQELGLSISTVSHHLRSLEHELGVSLLNHARRPMILTPAGVVYLRFIEEALALISRAETELVSGNTFEARSLRLGIVEDFEGEVAPELAQLLALAMPKCKFRHYSRLSHEILALLRSQELDIGIATRPMHDLPELVEYPLFRDPFVLATPASSQTPAEDYLSGNSKLPFLRYADNQIIGGLIAAQLSRLRISLPNRFELESNQSLLGMVAESSGWTITTPASFSRAKRYQSQITLHRFPGKGFSRTISLFASDAYLKPVVEIVIASLRRLLRQRVVDPLVAEMPWLKDSFYLVGEPEK